MKRLALLFCLVLMVLTTACNEVGTLPDGQDRPCVGVGSDERDPNLRYRMSGWNVAMGIIFSETIVVPVVVLTSETFCPYAYVNPPAGTVLHH